MAFEIIIPVLAVVLAWFLNERSKRIFEEYKRKEDSYKKLIGSSRGFYISHNDNKLRNRFINELNICWLYAPDEVINKGNKFFENLLDNNTDEALNSLAKLVEEMRNDLIKRKTVKKTALNSENFLHMRTR